MLEMHSPSLRYGQIGQFLSKSDKYCQSGRKMRTPPRSFETELLDAVAQLAKRQPKNLGGSGLVVTGFFQRVDNGLPLHVLDPASEVG